MYIETLLRLILEQVEVLQGGDCDFQVTDDCDPDGLHIEHTMMMGKKKYTTDLIVKGVRPTSQHLLMRLGGVFANRMLDCKEPPSREFEGFHVDKTTRSLELALRDRASSFIR